MDIRLKWLNWFHLLILKGDLLVILIDSMIFFIAIRRCYNDVYASTLFPRTARFWNCVPVEWFPLSYELNGFNSMINRHLLTVGSF